MIPQSNLALVSTPANEQSAPIPSFQLERDALTKRAELSSLKRNLRSLEALRRAVTDAAATLSLKPGDAQATDRHEAALRALGEALREYEQVEEMEHTVAALELEASAAKNRERAQAAALADSALEQAQAEFMSLSLATAKAFRTLLSVNAQAMATPGARAISPPLGFNIEHLAYQQGRDFPLGQQMYQGRMPWEDK